MANIGPRQGNPFLRMTTAARCLSLDLEVGVKDRRTRAFAGVRPDTGQSLVFPIAGNSLAGAFAKLDDLAGGAEFLLGHNFIEFDLPHLKAASPNLGLLRPMQQSIVEVAMAGEHVLGILPTGAGKSLCYQVPSLSRYDKTGALTSQPRLTKSRTFTLTLTLDL